jgi:hypothetical protein
MLLWNISNEYIAMCSAGGRLEAHQAEALERQVSLGDTDLNVRLQLIGYSTVKLLRSSHHVLWMIEHYPTIELHAHWAVEKELAEAAKQLWERQISKIGGAQVLANAAWSLIWHYESWAEARYAQAEGLGPHNELNWSYSKAALFELLADEAQSNDSRQRHSRALLRSLLRAFAVEPDPARQLKLVFQARQAAVAAAKDSTEHRLLVLADAAGTRASRAGIDTTSGLQSLHVVRGLVALARGLRMEALVELEAATAATQDPTKVDEGVAVLAREAAANDPDR